MQNNHKKYFDLLQLSTDASLDEVHEAYLLLSEKVDPEQYPVDSKKHKSEQQILRDLDEAHDKLKELYASGYNPHEVPVDFSEFETPPQMQELTNEQYLIASHPLFSSFLSRILEFDEIYQKLSRENLVTRPIKDAKVGTFSYQPISLLANIHSRTEPKPISREVNGSHIDLPTVELTLSDHNGDQIKCLPIDFGKYSKKFGDLLYSRQVLRCVGFVIPIDNAVYYFYLKSIESNLNALDLIGLNPDRMEYALEVYRKALKYKGGLRAYIKDKIVKELSITGLDMAIELDKAIDFIILQSFSFGKSFDKMHSNKLHSLVIGSPATGKSLLTKIACILNPVAYEIIASPKRLTSAGLIGNVTRKGNIFISNPGYFPLSSGGIVCIQDFHEYISHGGKAVDLDTYLADLMENGKVIDPTAARTVHIAETAIHFDMNRLSQVNPHKKYPGHKDIGIPTNILTRFDFILEIPRNVATQMHVALNMIDGWKGLGGFYSEASQSKDWIRDLKVIVAFQNSMFRVISSGPGVQNLVKKNLAKIHKKFTQESKQDYHFSDFAPRLANSVNKYLDAIACSEARTTILKKDVKEAFSFIDYKLKFLFKSEPVLAKMNPIQERCDIILEKFRDTSAKRKDIIDYVNSKASKPVRGKTIDRDLEVLEKEGKAKKVKQGLWRID